MLAINDFFCGCGGIALGFKAAGFEVVGAWDKDKHAVATYRANIGDYVEQMDIKRMAYLDIPKANVWGFGFPCQDISSASPSPAGLIEGDRSKLFFQIMRLLDEALEHSPDLVPDFLLAENVKELGKYLHIVEAEYAKRGYKMKAKLFNSKHWGVAQDRKRYYVVGVREGLDFEFPEEDTDSLIPLSMALDPMVPDSYFVSKEQEEYVLKEARLREEIYGVHACLTPHRPKRQNGRRAKGHEEPSHTLTAQDWHGVIIDGRVRNFTPWECGRLHGFPMDRWVQVVSAKEALKQFGNSVTVPLVAAVARQVRSSLLS